MKFNIMEVIVTETDDFDVYYSDDESGEQTIDVNIGPTKAIESSSEESTQPSLDSALSANSAAHDVFARRLTQAFNDPKDSDIEFKADDKTIYCHKTVLRLRNGKFWQYLSRKGDPEDEIVMNGQNYQTFYAFIQYLYGIAPQIEDRFAADLQIMAKLFDEPELEAQCQQLIQNCKNWIDESNVCQLYEKAITEDLTDLEKSCVEFAANNWKNVCKSDAFQAMDDKLSKQMIISVLK